MKSKLKRRILTGLGLIALTAIAITIWSNLTIVSDDSKADPAVIVANEIGTKDVPYTEGYVGEKGSRIHYVSAGEGDAIIFLHGFPSYWFTMFGLMEEFKSDYNVIALDGLGTGKSDAPGAVSEYTLEKMVNHVDAVIEELDLKTVHFVGHDWGAVIASGYVQAYPEKVETVTLMSALPLNIILNRVETDKDHQELFSYTTYFSRANPTLIKLMGIQENLWEDIYMPFEDAGIIPAAQAERFRQDIGQPRRLNRLINWYRANMPDYTKITDSHFWPERNARITTPAIFIYGENDIVVTEPLVADLQASADNLKVIKFANTEHRPHYQEKQAVVRHIREHIEQE